MGKSNKRKKGDILFELILIILILSFIFFISRAAIISFDYNDVCKYKYGENYTYEHDVDFGRYCMELNYEELTKINPIKINWTNQEIRKMCNVPEFFELSKWNKGIC